MRDEYRSPREVARTSLVQGFLDSHVNSIAIYVLMAAPYVQARKKRRLPCPDQPDPRPDPIPDPEPNATFWGARGLLSRSAGAALSLRANLKTLHVRAYKRFGLNTVNAVNKVSSCIWF